jgi:hypothetical protein
LFMLVACTAYQLITPNGTPDSLWNSNWTMVLSTLCLYLRARNSRHAHRQPSCINAEPWREKLGSGGIS